MQKYVWLYFETINPTEAFHSWKWATSGLFSGLASSTSAKKRADWYPKMTLKSVSAWFSSQWKSKKFSLEEKTNNFMNIPLKRSVFHSWSLCLDDATSMRKARGYPRKINLIVMVELVFCSEKRIHFKYQ